MIDEVDGRLRDWVESVLSGVTVSFEPPAAEKPSQCVNLFLYELVHDPPARMATPPPLQLSLRYLVTTWSEQAQESHRMLSDLVFAAMENRGFETELTPLSAHAWSALKVAPRPSFTIRIPVRHERAAPKVKRVRAPLLVDSAPIRPFHGIVLGPGDIPLANARIELSTLNLASETDAGGRFRLAGVPSTGKPQQFRIKARGHAVSVSTAESHPNPDDPFVVHFSLPEE